MSLTSYLAAPPRDFYGAPFGAGRVISRGNPTTQGKLWPIRQVALGCGTMPPPPPASFHDSIFLSRLKTNGFARFVLGIRADRFGMSPADANRRHTHDRPQISRRGPHRSRFSPTHQTRGLGAHNRPGEIART